MELKADLHIHTCLSPCAEPEMVPTMIVAAARVRGLDIIGICDHNSAENVAAVKACAREEDLLVLGGMEITSAEEVHVLGYFEDDGALNDAQDAVYDELEGENDEAAFGPQWIVDEHDVVVESNARLLIGATRLSIDDVVKLIHRLGGLAVASHIDREAFSLFGQLGFIPPELALDALELSPGHTVAARSGFDRLGLPLICNSDAHVLADIGRAYTTFTVQSPTFAEIAMALRGEKGRCVRI